MELTKDQRHTAYIILLHEAKNTLKNKKYGIGLCHLISEYIDRSTNQTLDDDIDLSDLKELYDKQPPDAGGYWFGMTKSGWQKRIEILKSCIDETH